MQDLNQNKMKTVMQEFADKLEQMAVIREQEGSACAGVWNTIHHWATQMVDVENERITKICYGVWRAFETGSNYIYISKDLSILGFVNPLSEEDRLKIDVELFLKIES